MEDEDIVVELMTPYYEIEYLDDDNLKHLGKVQTIDNLDFMKERFTVITSKQID